MGMVRNGKDNPLPRDIGDVKDKSLGSVLSFVAHRPNKISNSGRPYNSFLSLVGRPTITDLLGLGDPSDHTLDANHPLPRSNPSIKTITMWAISKNMKEMVTPTLCFVFMWVRTKVVVSY